MTEDITINNSNDLHRIQSEIAALPGVTAEEARRMVATLQRDYARLLGDCRGKTTGPRMPPRLPARRTTTLALL